MLGTKLAPRTRHHDCIQMMPHATLEVCLSKKRPYSGFAQSDVAFASIPRKPTCRTGILPCGRRSQICDRREAIAVFTRSSFQPFRCLGLLGPTVKSFFDARLRARMCRDCQARRRCHFLVEENRNVGHRKTLPSIHERPGQALDIYVQAERGSCASRSDISKILKQARSGSYA